MSVSLKLRKAFNMSHLYTMTYMTMDKINAVMTSKTECCLMSMVDNTMDIHKSPDVHCTNLFLASRSLLAIARCVPSELYTWMLGHRFVAVSF